MKIMMHLFTVIMVIFGSGLLLGTGFGLQKPEFVMLTFLSWVLMVPSIIKIRDFIDKHD